MSTPDALRRAMVRQIIMAREDPRSLDLESLARSYGLALEVVAEIYADVDLRRRIASL